MSSEEARNERKFARAEPPTIVAAHIVQSLEGGGAERAVLDLVDSFGPGVRPIVITLYDSPGGTNSLIEQGIEVLRMGKQRPGFSPRLLIKLVQVLRTLHADVVHTHMVGPSIYGRVAAILARVPVLVHTEHAAGAPSDHFRRVHLPLRLLGRWTDALIVFSDELVRSAGGLGLAPTDRIQVIPNGIPLVSEASESDRLTLRKALGVSDREFFIMAVGALRPQKGYELLLRASHLARQKYSKLPLKVWVVGAGPEWHRLSDQKRKLALDCVTLVGNKSEPRELLAACDAFVNTSTWESMPIAVLEAMASGRAILAPRVGSLPHLLRDRAGLLVDRTDEALADGILDLFANDQLREELGRTARQRVASQYSSKRIAQTHESLYRSLINDKLGCNAVEPFITSDEAEEFSSAGRQDEDSCPKVLLVGAFPSRPSDEIRGGQVSLCSALINSPLASEFELITLDTTQKSIPPPPLQTRLLAALGRLRRFDRLLRGDGLEAVTIMSSSRASCVEKGVMIWLARQRCVGAAFYLVSTRLFKDAQVSLLWRWWLRRLITWSDLLVCQGSTMARQYEELAGSRIPTCVVIPNLLDLSGWGPENPSNAEKTQTTTVLFSGRIDRDKGVFDLIEAIDGSDLLRRQQIVLCGGGAHLDELTDLVRDLKLDGTVTLAGWVDQKKLKRWFSRAQIFVLPSHSEGLPMSLIEALVSGKAAVTTSVGVVPDYVKDGEHALLVPPQDPPALRLALENLVSDPQMRSRLAQNGARMARATFDARLAYQPFADSLYLLRDITTLRRVPSQRRRHLCRSRQENSRMGRTRRV